MKDVYISYLPKDRKVAEDLASALENGGVSCYIASRDLVSEESKTLQIVDAISNCKLFLLIASRKVNHSAEIFNELDIAQSKEKPILSVFTDLFSVSIELRKRLHKATIHRAPRNKLKYHFKRILLTVKYFLDPNKPKSTLPKQCDENQNGDFPVSTYNESSPFIFISYSHRNSEKVLKIVERLQEDGYRVWYDEGIDPGTEWDEFIAEKIENSSFFIAFMSQEYLDSKNCKDELNYARDLDKDRLLVYLSDVKLAGGMAMRLNRLQAIHEYAYSSFDSFIEKLESTPALEAFKD